MLLQIYLLIIERISIKIDMYATSSLMDYLQKKNL